MDLVANHPSQTEMNIEIQFDLNLAEPEVLARYISSFISRHANHFNSMVFL